MGIFDNIKMNYKKYRSKREESDKVDSIRDEMEERNLVIRDQLIKIGQYYWKLYYDGEYAPGDDLEYFTTIDKCNEELKYLANKADNHRVVGEAERIALENDCIHNENNRKARAEERREAKRVKAERRREEKMAEQEKRKVEAEKRKAEAAHRKAERKAEQEKRKAKSRGDPDPEVTDDPASDDTSR